MLQRCEAGRQDRAYQAARDSHSLRIHAKKVFDTLVDKCHPYAGALLIFSVSIPNLSALHKGGWKKSWIRRVPIWDALGQDKKKMWFGATRRGRAKKARFSVVTLHC